MRTVVFIFLLCLVYSCREQSRPFTETSNGKAGVGSTEKPVEKTIQGIRFQQKGLEIEDAEIFLQGGGMLTVNDSVGATDTVLMPLHIRGWHAPDGVARLKVSSILRRPDGSIEHEMNISKQVIPFDITEGVFRSMEVFTELDTTVAYYDTEFTITDVGNGRSLTGTYRYKLK